MHRKKALAVFFGIFLVLLFASCGGSGGGDGGGGSPVVAQCVDNDGDGYGTNCSAGADCDDTNAAIHPGATEVLNGKDDNCNGQIDEGLVGVLSGSIVSCTSLRWDVSGEDWTPPITTTSHRTFNDGLCITDTGTRTTGDGIVYTYSINITWNSSRCISSFRATVSGGILNPSPQTITVP